MPHHMTPRIVASPTAENNIDQPAILPTPKYMDHVLDGLNTGQRAAVSSPASILQVLAPPGSGKTKTLTARVAYLLTHDGHRPQDVICCTFTIKASREMRERIGKLLGDNVVSTLILGTFHSICRRYLVKYGYLIGLQRGFGIADSSDSLAIIRVWSTMADCVYWIVAYGRSSAENTEAIEPQYAAQFGTVEDILSKSAWDQSGRAVREG